MLEKFNGFRFQNRVVSLKSPLLASLRAKAFSDRLF